LRIDPRRSAPVVVAHDGELGDVCRLLEELGAHWTEIQGRAPGRETLEGARAVIATPQRLLEGRFAPCSTTQRVAIVERSTKTLISTLRRAGVQRVVARPVHPAALRGLLLHAIYCGPEKRRRERVSVGAPVSFRSGLLPRRAILAELSVRGCRLLTRYAAKRDSALRIKVPARLTGGTVLSLHGRVVRTGPASGEDAGTQSLAVVFSQLTRPQMIALQRLVEAHATGPATLARGESGERRTAAVRPERPGSPDPQPAAARATAAPVAPAVVPDPPPQTQTEAEPEADSDRRGEARREYDRSVIALGHEAARVVFGRDISRGGMRIEPHPNLAVGDVLRLALHLGNRSEPMVVGGRVHRDDGERGLVLLFDELTGSSADHFEKLVSHLPRLESAPPGEGSATSEESEDSETIVSQILERIPG